MKMVLVAGGIVAMLVFAATGCDNTTSQVPELICEHDGVKVWTIITSHNDRIYFTTPVGNVEWDQRVGKHTEKRQTLGNPESKGRTK